MKKGQVPLWLAFMIAGLGKCARMFPMLTKPPLGVSDGTISQELIVRGPVCLGHVDQPLMARMGVDD